MGSAQLRDGTTLPRLSLKRRSMIYIRSSITSLIRKPPGQPPKELKVFPRKRSLSLNHRQSVERYFFPTRNPGPRSTIQPGKRLSLLIGNVNRREKIVQRFILHMQLGVLMRQTTHMHSTTGNQTIHARDLETRVGDWTLDAIYRSKNRSIFLNAMFGLVLAMWEMQNSWDNAIASADTDWTVGDGGSVRALGITSTSTILKMVISFSTLVLVCQVVDLYRLFLKEKHTIWGDPVESGPGPVWSVSLLVPLAFEICILSVHPVPFLEDMVHQAASCIMFSRVYLLARVYRDYSDVYKLRKDIVQKRFLHSVSPLFNWALPIKVAFEEFPFRVIIFFFVLGLAIYSVSIYVLERQYQPEAFTYANSTWYTFCHLNIHKLHFHAHTWKGRFATAGMIIVGVLFETVLVVAIHHKIGLNDKDHLMLAYIQRTESSAALERAARKAIRLWLRWKLAIRSPPDTNLHTPLSKNPSSRTMVVMPIVPDIKWKKYKAAYWRAIEKFRQAKSSQVLVEQAVSNPVLDKLQALEAAVLKIKAMVNEPKCATCGGIQRKRLPRSNEVPSPDPTDPMYQQLHALKQAQDEIDAQQQHIQQLLLRVA